MLSTLHLNAYSDMVQIRFEFLLALARVDGKMSQILPFRRKGLP